MIPNQKEILDFIRHHDIINFSMIARHFDIQNMTVSDLIKDLEKKKLVIVKQLGGSKVVRIKEK